MRTIKTGLYFTAVPHFKQPRTREEMEAYARHRMTVGYAVLAICATAESVFHIAPASIVHAVAYAGIAAQIAAGLKSGE